jgi:hypothetical protein
MLTQPYNKTINAITLRTPLGCMGEIACYTARMERSGALVYFGQVNVERLGEHLGDVGEADFDRLASVIETSGFLDIASYGTVASTAGENEIELETTNGTMKFTRDVVDSCPIFWAVETLCKKLIGNACWGMDAYLRATTDPKDLPEPIHILEEELNHDRRVMPNSAAKRLLRKYRVQPPEKRGGDKWIAYRFVDGKFKEYVEYDRTTRTYTVCGLGYRSSPCTMADLLDYFAREANDTETDE